MEYNSVFFLIEKPNELHRKKTLCIRPWISDIASPGLVSTYFPYHIQLSHFISATFKFCWSPQDFPHWSQRSWMLPPLFLSISLAGKCGDLEAYIYSDQLHRYFELKLTEEKRGLFCTVLFSFLGFFPPLASPLLLVERTGSWWYSLSSLFEDKVWYIFISLLPTFFVYLKGKLDYLRTHVPILCIYSYPLLFVSISIYPSVSTFVTHYCEECFLF